MLSPQRAIPSSGVSIGKEPEAGVVPRGPLTRALEADLAPAIVTTAPLARAVRAPSRIGFRIGMVRGLPFRMRRVV